MSDRSPTKRRVSELINIDRTPDKLSRQQTNSESPMSNQPLVADEPRPSHLTSILKADRDDQNNNENSEAAESGEEKKERSNTVTVSLTKENKVRIEFPKKQKSPQTFTTYDKRSGYLVASRDRNVNAGIKCEHFDSGKCNYSTRHRALMTRHMLSHSDVRAHECDLCPAKYKDKNHLTQHKQIHDEDNLTGGKGSSKDRDNPLEMKCSHWGEGCNWSFTRLSWKERHERIHSDEFLYECEECDKKYNQESHLRHHIVTKHTSDEKFTCPLCDRNLSPYSLYGHLKRHVLWDSFNCKCCDFETHLKEEWFQHLISKNHREKYTPSNIRPMSIKNKEDYKSEIELELSNEPVFIKCKNKDTCPVCSRVMEFVSKIAYGGYYAEVMPGLTCQSSHIFYMWINKKTNKPIYRKQRYLGITDSTLYCRIEQYHSGMTRAGRLITELFDKDGDYLSLIPILQTDTTDPNALGQAEKNFISCLILGNQSMEVAMFYLVVRVLKICHLGLLIGSTQKDY